MIVEFFIEGVPKATQTGYIAINRRTGKPFPVRRNPEWIAHCRATAEKAMEGDPPMAGSIEAVLLFVFPAPRRTKVGYPANNDLGNLEKGVMDAMNEVVYNDDVQVIRLMLAKRFAKGREAPGVHVLVTPAAVE